VQAHDQLAVDHVNVDSRRRRELLHADIFDAIRTTLDRFAEIEPRRLIT
jgi:hypothetical protein